MISFTESERQSRHFGVVMPPSLMDLQFSLNDSGIVLYIGFYWEMKGFEGDIDP